MHMSFYLGLVTRVYHFLSNLVDLIAYLFFFQLLCRFSYFLYEATKRFFVNILVIYSINDIRHPSVQLQVLQVFDDMLYFQGALGS